MDYRFFREKYRLTREELGNILNVSKDVIYNIETGRTVPSSEMRQKYEIVFGTFKEEVDIEDSQYSRQQLSISERLELFALPIEKIQAIYKYAEDLQYRSIKQKNGYRLRERLLEAFDMLKTAEQQESVVNLLESLVKPDVLI